MRDLMNTFGPIDIYLFDQLLRGRIMPGMRVLDVGCGGGRNLVYLLREGFEVYGVDEDPRAVASVREMAVALGGVADRFRVEAVEAMSFEEGFAEVVICERGAALCARRWAVRSDAAGGVAGVAAGRAVV